MRRLVLWAWIGVVAFLLADIAGLFAERKLSSQTGSPPPPTLAPSQAPSAVANLEGTLPGPSPQAEPTVAPRFTLRGTVVGEKASLALVLHQEEFVALAVGESVEGWKLTRVEPERALFEKDGQTHVALMSDEARSALAPKASPSELSREDRNELALADLIEGAELKADPRGIRVVTLKPTSLLAGFGLQPRDLILSLNGRQVRNLEQAGQALAELAGADDFGLELERDGKLVPLHVSLKR